LFSALFCIGATLLTMQKFTGIKTAVALSILCVPAIYKNCAEIMWKRTARRCNLCNKVIHSEPLFPIHMTFIFVLNILTMVMTYITVCIVRQSKAQTGGCVVNIYWAISSYGGHY
jgi:hypothetical protein